ncbi:MAG: PIN domain-containing protein [Anaerolineae bacterium]|nr:PIN domain-containing protein [Anaerolineae bacterium]
MRHPAARQLIDQIASKRPIVVMPVLVEVFYFAVLHAGYLPAVDMFALVLASFDIETLTHDDMLRMQHIMRHYKDAQFDFADAAIMAVSERLGIARIATFDRRDFTVYRPVHVTHYELLP